MTSPAGVGFVGSGLDRPECVIATASGDLFVSHRTRGVARVAPDGTVTVLSDPVSYRGVPLLPNGIALRRDGSFLVSNIADPGGLFVLDAEGCRPFVTEMNGRPLPPINFVTLDETGRVWFSVSSALHPRHLAYRKDVRNGFVAVIEDGHPRIVVDGLHYTNEIRPDLEAGVLYVSETFGKHISRFPLSGDLEAGPREIAAAFPRGAFVDGFALDVDGGLVAACIVSNEIFHVHADGSLHRLLGERDDTWVDEVEASLDAGTMGRRHFDQAPSGILCNVSSVAFRGEHLDELVCGSLLGDRLVTLPAPAKGRAPVHWNWRAFD